MIIVYLFLGVLAATVGALPLGASNVAVINTTLKQSTKHALKIALTAGIAEVILSYYALHCNMVVRDFFNDNLWVQILIAILLLAIGVFLFFKKERKKQHSNKKRLTKSKYATGFLLGLLNPPVLIYWVIIYGLINNTDDFMLSLQSSITVLFLFFSGVYIGKLLTLYIYSKFSVMLKNKIQNINAIVNKVTGILLAFVGIVQAFKLYAF